MEGSPKRILMAPLDPVHDVGLRLIARELAARGYETIVLPPDTTVEEVVNAAIAHQPDVVLVGRTVGYQVAEIMARLVDLLDAAGVRQKAKLGLGGMAVKAELAAELGFDAGFGPGTRIEEVVAFIEDQECAVCTVDGAPKEKVDVTRKYGYCYLNPEIGKALDSIAAQALAWYATVTSPGLERARLRQQMILLQQKAETGVLGAADAAALRSFRVDYGKLCDGIVAKFYQEGVQPTIARVLSKEEVDGIVAYSARYKSAGKRLQHVNGQPMVFVQYGTGCPIMDIAHIKACEAWGADGVLHFDPSWGARAEGYLEGYFSHQESGTLYTPEIVRLMRKCISPSTVWNLRAHRGINTAETVVLAGLLGADMVKINASYGCLAGGTDPERMLADSIGATAYAAQYNLPFDIPIGQELSGVPTKKSFAGMLIAAAIGLKLGARPILNPQFSYSPNVMLGGQMEEDFVDYNVARIQSLRRIIDAPIRAGEPIAFMTHTEERMQSGVTTALHAALGASLDLDALTIASTDEAYSGGPITVSARIDTLRSVKETFRFFGTAKITPNPRAETWTEELVQGVAETLQAVEKRGDLVASFYEGLLGNKEDGANPGRFGKGTVRTK